MIRYTGRHIARHIANAATAFPFLGPVTEEALLDLVKGELGHEEILDRWIPYGGAWTRAIAPAQIVHIISGNTPHAGLQSLLRGLLLGSHNRCKIPSAGLPEIAAFRDRLPAELARRVEIERTLPDSWLVEADAVIVFGSDETISTLRVRLRPDQIFIPHGHRLSFGIVFEDPGFKSVPQAARDASLFDQQGCLSPHLFYVAAPQAEAYAERLAAAMADFAATNPGGELTLSEKAGIAAVRSEFAFRAATDSRVRIWQSDSSSSWTVLLDPNPEFTPSCLNRTVYVKPLPSDLAKHLAPIRPHLSAIGIFPATLENATLAAATGASRICPIGTMQLPPLTWHQDGAPVLAPLVRWVDAETA